MDWPNTKEDVVKNDYPMNWTEYSVFNSSFISISSLFLPSPALRTDILNLISLTDVLSFFRLNSNSSNF